MNSYQQQPHWTNLAGMIVPTRRRDLVIEQLDSEAVVSDPINDNVSRLNETALMVWQRCDGQATAGQIAQALTDKYDVDLDSALDQVGQLVALFAESQLLDLNDDLVSAR